MSLHRITNCITGSCLIRSVTVAFKLHIMDFQTTGRRGVCDLEDNRNALVNLITPRLDAAKHKGQRGKVAVIGGSTEYTGAPYFAAMSALKLGADLAHVFCPPDAATVIKCYSPDLIVHPLLAENGIDDICDWFKRMNAVIIGPGLGRDVSLSVHLVKLITKCREINLPLIIDADGLHFLTEDLSIRNAIYQYNRAVITPNVNEFNRLYKVLMDDELPISGFEATYDIANKLGNVTVVRKGLSDIISDGIESVQCNEEGSMCRCGGQGDMLSGFIGTFAYWACHNEQLDTLAKNNLFNKFGPMVSAAYAGCIMTRKCNYLTFNLIKHGAPLRDAMNMTDMLDMVHVVKYSLTKSD